MQNNTTSIAGNSIIYFTSSEKVVFTFGLSLLSLFTLFGNVLVVTAFLTYRPLRTYTNYFIISLSVSDILVAIISMPVWMVVVLSDYDIKLLIGAKVFHNYFIFLKLNLLLISFWNFSQNNWRQGIKQAYKVTLSLHIYKFCI